ncbi:MAG: serine hydrolase [Actinobacteria bacterium]|nr:serine hydrolase [Actinomycetota bacterium]
MTQPVGVPWPTHQWPDGDVSTVANPARLITASNQLFDEPSSDTHGASLALVVVHRGRVVHERYGVQPDTPFGPGGPVDADTTLISWSMAKSITHALVGFLVDEQRLDPSAPAPVAEWSNDDRRNITLGNLLQMRDGLDFVEEYVAGENAPVPHVIDMLFGSGADDVASFAKSRPVKHEPGSVWNYSSGTTNIVSSIVAQTIATTHDITSFVEQRLFAPIGMTSATARLDAAGTFIGSSYVYATARDFAKFGYLYLRDGEWDGARLLSREWVAGAKRQHAADPETNHGYGSHWWIWKSMSGVSAALGYEGQRMIVDPRRDTVVVHLGKWVHDTQPLLDRLLTDVLEATA